MSRPNKGVEHVDAVEGAPEAKARLTAVLETIAGTCSVDEACRRLAVSPTRFDQLRQAALEGAVAALSPKPQGRPPTPAPDDETIRLRERVAHLERENATLRIREEIAIHAPGLLSARSVKGGRRPTERNPSS